MKHILLITKIIFITFFSLITFACFRNECIDKDKYLSVKEQARLWIPDNSNLINKDFVDSKNISQTLLIKENQLIDDEDDYVFWDECDVGFSDLNYSLAYSGSLNNIRISVTIEVSILNETEYLKFSTYNLGEYGSYVATYNLISLKSENSLANFALLDSISSGSEAFDNVLEVIFNYDKLEDTDVKKLYYSQEYGLIKYEYLNGNVFQFK